MESVLERLGDLLDEDITLRRDASAERRGQRVYDRASNGRAEPRDDRMGVVDIDDHRAGTWMWMFKAFPAMMAELDRVPETHWSSEFAGDGEEQVQLASVRCPCGETPLVELHQMRPCACERQFLYLKPDGLYVANSPKRRRAQKPRWEEIADAAAADRRTSSV